MLALSPKDVFKKNDIALKAVRNGEYCFSKCFCLGEQMELELYVKRNLGIIKPQLCFMPDNEIDKTFFKLFYCETKGMYDIYRLCINTRQLCEKPSIVFCYIAFSLGDSTIYFASKNNVDGFLTYSQSEAKNNQFKLLLYKKSYLTPKWFHRCVMYHAFVDRFFKGSVDVPLRNDAQMNYDWYEGTPQYGNFPGDFCSNNMFFGGTLYGIAEKLDYLASLGVGVIYLSPIFEAYSNHKYDTGDYGVVDEMFGGDKALDMLICECERRGIKIILDGVFNHTGDDSVYFNRYKRYGEGGAYNDCSSPYSSWYSFTSFPDKYSCWWGITILPKLNTKNKEVEDFFVGKGGIVEKYLERGVFGYRLDVADELPDSFLTKLRSTAKACNKNAVIIGEVWENAADKCAYGQRRQYFQGSQLDGVMNYPIKNAIIDYVRHTDAEVLYDAVCDIYSSYPKESALSLMNILGTHDTERILTVLATERYVGMCGDELKDFKLTKQEYDFGRELLLCASVLQYTLPGVPSLYYGDEAGVSGGRDPFCRSPYPWGREDENILSHYKTLGEIRAKSRELSSGELEIVFAQGGAFAFLRKTAKNQLLIAVNVGQQSFIPTINGKKIKEVLYSKNCLSNDDKLSISKNGFAIARLV